MQFCHLSLVTFSCDGIIFTCFSDISMTFLTSFSFNLQVLCLVYWHSTACILWGTDIEYYQPYSWHFANQIWRQCAVTSWVDDNAHNWLCTTATPTLEEWMKIENYTECNECMSYEDFYTTAIIDIVKEKYLIYLVSYLSSQRSDLVLTVLTLQYCGSHVSYCCCVWNTTRPFSLSVN